MKFEIEDQVPSKKSESSDFYVDFSLKLLSALKERVQEHNDKNEKKISLNQVIEKYYSAASKYTKDESIDINTHSMAKVNEFLEGRKGEINFDNAEKDTEKLESQNGISFSSKVGTTKLYEVVGRPYIINYTRL
jgi:hypothetical protein